MAWLARVAQGLGAGTRVLPGLRGLEEENRTSQLVLQTELFAIAKIRDRKLVWCNRGFESLFGYGHGEASGLDVRNGYPDEAAYQALGAESYPIIAAGGTYTADVTMVRKDGSPIAIRLSGTQIDPARNETIWLFCDISEHKSAENALRISQSFLSRTGAAAGVGGWELEVGAETVSWSDETCRLHDAPAGHRPTLREAIEYYAEADRPVIESLVKDAIQHGQGWDVELQLVSATGRTFWARVVGAVECESGRPVRLVGAFQDITARRKLTDEADRLAIVVKQMTNAVVMTDPGGHITWLNDAFVKLTGYALPEVIGRKPGHFLQGPETDRDTAAHMSTCLARGVGFDVEVTNYTKTGEPYWIAVTCTPLRCNEGGLTGFIAVESDVSARRRAEEALQREAAERKKAEIMLRDVLEAIPNAVIAYGPDERVILRNRAYTEIFPLESPHAQPGRLMEDVLRAGAEAGQFPLAGSTPVEREQWLAERLGAYRASVTSSPRTVALPGGRFVLARESRSSNGNLVCVRTETTHVMRAQADLQRLAERDALTGLPNRATFLASLAREVAAAGAGTGRGATLILLDIDYFKQINDTLGHDVGDVLLNEIAERLRINGRGSDVPARLGGDEFAMLMPGLVDPVTIAARMGGFHKALSEPVELGGKLSAIGISLGVTAFPQDGLDSEGLLKNADLALYEAKRSGRGRWCIFRQDHAQARAENDSLTDGLRQAIASNAIQVAFQPKRRTKGGHAGFEALARWNDGTRDVPPSQFIAAAEESGLIIPLGAAVMEAALARLRALRMCGATTGRVAVNVASAQLMDPSFLPDTLDALRRHDLGPGDLELEVTETVLLGRSAERIEQTLRDFRDRGVALALDDFGTGLASLSHLARLPLTSLKIDRSFVSEIGRGDRGGLIARVIIGLARGLGLESIAEGVETVEQVAFLQAEGCDVVQGYLYARPLATEDEILGYLRDHSSMAAARPRLRRV